jgi:hypothetical protein
LKAEIQAAGSSPWTNTGFFVSMSVIQRFVTAASMVSQ